MIQTHSDGGRWYVYVRQRQIIVITKQSGSRRCGLWAIVTRLNPSTRHIHSTLKPFAAASAARVLLTLLNLHLPHSRFMKFIFLIILIMIVRLTRIIARIWILILNSSRLTIHSIHSPFHNLNFFGLYIYFACQHYVSMFPNLSTGYQAVTLFSSGFDKSWIVY